MVVDAAQLLYMQVHLRTVGYRIEKLPDHLRLQIPYFFPVQI